ncbi:beta-class carbonic anhydrase [Streptomyces sp. NBC_01803]|uniref:beta-class carbonic anhydrase n=1 Tax=Streptomyces sp. NBC_01803 TaxID=2975946 RepID=UPI002DDA34A6|nr:carbonic anhydrase [Streptomyces sp. NBC_01803]WSA47024.1 carbonic anhydrase [Streptomyces sp. NBC_01803]
MSVTDEYPANNEAYAAPFTGPLPLPPSRQVAVVVRTDTRLNVNGVLGPREDEARAIRNADDVVTNDAIRSPAISQRLLGAREIILVHHTDRGMTTFTDDVVKRGIEEETGLRPGWAAESFPDAEEDVAQAARRIAAGPFVPHTDSLRGFVLDVATGRPKEAR